MILGDLLGTEAFDEHNSPVGHVIDARFVLEPAADGDNPTARLYGFVISPRTRSSYLGYDRNDVNAPVIIARLLAWRHRGSFLVLWDDVAAVTNQSMRLRPGYIRYMPGITASNRS